MSSRWDEEAVIEGIGSGRMVTGRKAEVTVVEDGSSLGTGWAGRGA
jgi:hypothetical protein